MSSNETSFDTDTVDIGYVMETARAAGVRAIQMAESMAPEFKSDHSYVTNIDRETEQFVRARLEARYPNYAFLGEEYGRHGNSDAPLWAVDPIDGTTNMVFGLPLWCVSIGLIANGRAQAGAVYLPRTDEMFSGVRGQGSYCNGARLEAKDRETIHIEDTLGFTSRAIQYLDTSVLPGRLRCLGSIATDIVYAARGTLCCLIGMHEGAYDIAAALCIAHEAGCTAAYLTGELLDIDTIVREGRTSAPFAIAPPRFLSQLQAQLHPR